MDDDECTRLGENDVILRELRVIEVLNGETGEIYTLDWSHDGSGGQLPLADTLELAEIAKAQATAPMIADLVFGYMQHIQFVEDEE